MFVWLIYFFPGPMEAPLLGGGASCVPVEVFAFTFFERAFFAGSNPASRIVRIVSFVRGCPVRGFDMALVFCFPRVEFFSKEIVNALPDPPYPADHLELF